ncbi:hypothetical protein PMI02_03874 [Novosphingobium sp. AP12]|nr:hypothetical protein PMI02_03874 [Novosphingobium sp. AP12]
MTLEYISAKPAESFIVFELEELMPSGVYDDVDSPFSEEIVEISRGVYAPRSAWDDGFYGYDENGDEIPLPEEARRIQRLFCGRLMMVTKGSLWNGSQLTYAGEHNYLANDAIRAQIERAVASGLPKLDPADRQHINARKRGSQQ